MSKDLINRYKKSIRLQFQNKELDSQYMAQQKNTGGKSTTLAFGVLLGLNLAFAYLEYKAFGRETAIPMIGYLVASSMALVNLIVGRIAPELEWLPARLLACIFISIGAVLSAVYLQKYSAYHAIEMSFLLFWLGSLSVFRVRITLILNLIFTSLFLAVMYQTGKSFFWVEIVLILLACAMVTAAAFAYLFERQRHILFLQTIDNESMINRQESWAFSLIDLDVALSDVHDFKEVMALLTEFFEPVIEFDSHILTSLEGQGPKPIADEVDGALFADDDNTLWSEELLGKLTQTRQATISAEQKTVTGFLGIKKQQFLSYRLDVPIVKDSKLVGVISLRRASSAFDDLDRIASVSIATQAMLIFRRAATASTVIVENLIPDPVIPRQDPDRTNLSRFVNTQTSDIELSDQTQTNPDVALVPSDFIKKVKEQEEIAKKTITLLSRENADKVAVDRYRTAAIEGEALSVLVIEVDGLSKLREQDGDPVAYKVFASIVKYIFSKIDKEKDILGRYGQNGISVLMPKVDMNAAERFAEMARQAIQSARYKTAYGEKSATLSIGVAAMTDETGDYNSMVKRADMALFVAKKNGRNCVKVRL
ncbi:MAG: diguanylate cyclase (GGDEF)-like protein [Gammaproteobacteria bacterium]